MFAVIGIAILVSLIFLLLALLALHWISKRKGWNHLRDLTKAFATLTLIGMLGICALGGMSLLIMLDIEGIHWSHPKQEAINGVYNLSRDSREWLKAEKGYADLSNVKITATNGKAILTNIPDCSIGGTGQSNGRLLSGKGNFVVIKSSLHHYNIKMNGSGDSVNEFSGFEIGITRRGDFRLTIGDPDASEYIYFERDKTSL